MNKVLPVFAIGLVFITGCGGGSTETVTFDQTVTAALDTIAEHGLPKWAEYGRSQADHVAIYPRSSGDVNAVPVNPQAAIWLPLTWNELSDDDRGAVLLDGLWRWRTGVYSRTETLQALLNSYRGNYEQATAGWGDCKTHSGIVFLWERGTSNGSAN